MAPFIPLALVLLLPASFWQCRNGLAITATQKTAIRKKPRFRLIRVYFFDSRRYQESAPPYETAVERRIPLDAPPPLATLNEYFKGPDPEERFAGIDMVTNGFTGFEVLDIRDGVARIRMTGPCISRGATYTIYDLLLKNLLQYPEIRFVKVYDQNGQTTSPEGDVHSRPPCLEP